MRFMGTAATPPATLLSGLFDVLDHHVRTRPDAPALVVTQQRIAVTYATLGRWADDVAAGLTADGLRRGQVI
ncbi:acyl-CoA synthetase, partial [Legionella pneumophila]